MTAKNRHILDPFVVIDLDHRWNSIKLYARLVWQVLFNEYRVDGDMDQMNSLLCDLYTIQDYFERQSAFEFIFLYSKHGYTEIEEIKAPATFTMLQDDERAVRVKYNPVDLTVKFYRVYAPETMELLERLDQKATQT